MPRRSPSQSVDLPWTADFVFLLRGRSLDYYPPGGSRVAEGCGPACPNTGDTAASPSIMPANTATEGLIVRIVVWSLGGCLPVDTGRILRCKRIEED